MQGNLRENDIVQEWDKKDFNGEAREGDEMGLRELHIEWFPLLFLSQDSGKHCAHPALVLPLAHEWVRPDEGGALPNNTVYSSFEHQM